MSRSVIYTVDADGQLTAMRPSEPRSEDFMQALVARYPEIIADADAGMRVEALLRDLAEQARA